MIADRSIYRYAGHWDLMAKLARWLLNSRADRYDALVAAGKMAEADAYVDETARRAIEADWTAIEARAPRSIEVADCPTAWKVRTLESALAILSRKVSSEDEADLRDATAYLLSCYSTDTVGLILYAHARRRA